MTLRAKTNALPRPVRVQLSRKKGWRMPPNTVRVARPGRWGNPFAVGGHYKRGTDFGLPFSWIQAMDGYEDERYTTIRTNAEAVAWFEWYMNETPRKKEECRTTLCGKNLACWCALDQPCHADVLIRIANGN